MSRRKRVSLDYYLNLFTPEQIEEAGGREALTKAFLETERKEFWKEFCHGVWFWTKGFILFMTAIYFVIMIFV